MASARGGRAITGQPTKNSTSRSQHLTNDVAFEAW